MSKLMRITLDFQEKTRFHKSKQIMYYYYF